jgi:hypothetical protein
MYLHKVKLTTIFVLLICFAKGQKIIPKDLAGSNCTIGLSEKVYFIIFNDTSNFSTFSKSSEFGEQRGVYSLYEINHQTTLTLHFQPYSYSQDKLFLMRKYDSNTYLLQIPKRASSGEIVYKWENIKSKNDFRLFVNKKI